MPKPVLLPGIQSSSGLRRETSPHRYTGPGEQQFAEWCQSLGLPCRHEPYLYELKRVFECGADGTIHQRVRRGFAPDFLIIVDQALPEVHVELTTAARNGRRTKTSKIRDTQASFKTHTILIIVHSPLWRRLEEDPTRLKKILLRASYRASAIAA